MSTQPEGTLSATEGSGAVGRHGNVVELEQPRVVMSIRRTWLTIEDRR